MSGFLRKTGIFSSIILCIIFTVAAVSLVISVLWPDVNLKSLSLFSNIWLIKIFKIQLGMITYKSLSGIYWSDILILVLFVFICLSLFERQNYNYKAWFLIACSLLTLGIIIFFITKQAGRSSFMASGLIISSHFFTGSFQSKIIAFIGILANVLLLTGDFTVCSGLKIVPVLFAAGYILLIIWLLMITSEFFKVSFK